MATPAVEPGTGDRTSTQVPRPRSRQRRMLIVEDDAAIADVLSTLLECDGFAVTVASDGLAALARVAADPPDLILLDLMIPGLNGLEVCRRIRASSRVPVIIVSARATDADKVLGLAAGADDYLTKPFLLRELRARIHAVLRRSPR